MGIEKSGGQLPILVADDDENDVLLLKMALKRSGIPNPVHVSPNGQDAVDYLCAKGPYADRAKYPFPAVLFLDIKMPETNGFYVLEWLHNHVECKVIPTIVLSSSKQAVDIKKAYQLGANAYLAKPGSFEGLQEAMRKIVEFWSACEKPEVSGNQC